MKSLADRVRFIVDLYWGGSVLAAANSLGIPQQTLHRIVTGQTTNPRQSVLVNMAGGCPVPVTLDWLLSGVGHPPRPMTPGEELSVLLRRFVADLRACDFDDSDIAGMLTLPLVYDPLSDGCRQSHVGRMIEWLERIK